ncbi:uroporphyrinogen-III C-methyltransferase [Thermosulfurimonas sp. F29]|uniref:uroporphyrinogen-III C-methyltransferase n=1 Tax=Thermosulfurimonas sp. F29 TaxID=2867247 RepID=UPI001C83B4A8|nr:uroporphyrinogen-III C-methyltransferase [Thermosulfurimonas sp. F29]MBX6423319.1 uroporphyrinogen-III C-methyltransferase [Thermosulfurimonas sp. F29]
MKKGKVYLVGAGPGDPGLITLKGIKALERAEVVIYDYLANPRLLSHVPEEAERIYVGKKGGHHTLSQEGINRLLVEKALSGRTVVRLKGGDPFIFGRGGEEIEALLEHGIPFEVIPGVTSAFAVPAYAGIPVTHRDYTSTLALVTGHEAEGKEDSAIDWTALSRIGTLIFLMGMKNLPRICENLRKNGRSPETPVVVIQWGTTPRQRVAEGTLEDIVERVKEAGLSAPAIILVGEVARLRKRFRWFEARPLFGKRIVVTRTREQASKLVESLEALGAECLEIPTIRIVPPESFEPLDAALREIESFDWVIFTSQNAVRYFRERLYAAGKDARSLSRARIAVIGTATARALEDVGLKADLIPEEFRAEGLVAAFERVDLKGRRILLPRAEVAREILPERLREMGATVEVVPAYRTVLPEESRRALISALEEGVDMVTFTSSSTARNFFRLIEGRERLLENVVLASIGPITSQTLRDLGYPPAVEAREYTIAGLVRAILEYFS